MAQHKERNNSKEEEKEALLAEPNRLCEGVCTTADPNGAKTLPRISWITDNQSWKGPCRAVVRNLFCTRDQFHAETLFQGPAPAAGLRTSRREVMEEQLQPPAEESSGPATEPSSSKNQSQNGCFGLKLVPVGMRSGLGCRGHIPKPTPGGS